MVPLILGALSSAYQSSSTSNVFQQRKQDFQNLAQAINAGDLKSAQAAYATLQKDLPAGAAANTNNPLETVGKALASGDISAAKTAFAALKTGHHHSHHGTPAQAPAMTPSAVASAPSDSPRAGFGGSIDLTA